MVSSQLESLNVISPPLPASLPLNSSINVKNAGSCVVTVNDSQVESLMEESNTAGLPSPGRLAARVCHSCQDPDDPDVSSTGAAVVEPVVEFAVIDPLVTSTRSPGSSVSSRVWPPCSVVIP